MMMHYGEEKTCDLFTLTLLFKDRSLYSLTHGIVVKSTDLGATLFEVALWLQHTPARQPQGGDISVPSYCCATDVQKFLILKNCPFKQ